MEEMRIGTRVIVMYVMMAATINDVELDML
jgi:hypothetical protein